MSRQHFGAIGKLQLSCDIQESGSGHIEEDYVLKLEGSNDEVILTDSYEFSNMYKSSQNEMKEKKYKISVSKLVELIKQNGIKI